MTRLDTQQSFIDKNIDTESYSKQAHQMVKSVFQVFDQDNSGCLKKTEFIKFLSTIIINLGGDEPTLQDIQQIMWQLDTNGDGQINKKQIMVLIDDAINIMKQNPTKNTSNKNKKRISNKN